MTLKSALVILSGGQDSATCLFWAQKFFDRVAAISFNYRQRHVIELEQAAHLAKIAGVSHQVIDLGFLETLNATALTDSSLEPSLTGGFQNLPSTFVPGRNSIFLSVAAGYALPRGLTSLVTGVCETDFSGYPDCRLKFIEAQENALSLALDSELKIYTPLMTLDKAQTFALAAELGVLETILEHTTTCYYGNRTIRHEWGYGCGECPSCQLRARGFESFKLGLASLNVESLKMVRKEASVWL